MANEFKRQTTDSANEQGYGTKDLSGDLNYVFANEVEDGGASQKGKKVPAKNEGTK